jgi:hypothetical protein
LPKRIRKYKKEWRKNPQRTIGLSPELWAEFDRRRELADRSIPEEIEFALRFYYRALDMHERQTTEDN